ncbi:uncharacterized protein KNAG_0B05370 [Huiozyma naganishii CBS 8797]|uniref:Uncharacterized protein n=1 Tax=Huiozyma naganishii (strain ATCC MYA-139 / BCRC 22969 / CBS 8797 / KCTC 17520 / NBRC 10181 / NCYC 3082 / Yp74L-3) TaxID=1071383 RepID=J7R2E6_HUIN7|nr:hypothetical protein KNAG_0B05370 [Kazachstania naganishii CBS 8797]CCK68970.1 hypothetical protein KNAG_0B05370 [Kazachstania naganishii CBS 8797]
MYLMKLEVESLEQIKYDRLIIYGLDVLLAEDGETTDEQSSVNSKQVRLCNLVYHALYKINRKYELKEVKAVSYNSTTQLSKQLARIESYWKHVC